MIINAGRTIVRRLALREPVWSTDRVSQLSHNPLRVINTSHTASAFSSGSGRIVKGIIISIARRSYATKPASRPKAHTGRTTSKPRKKAATTTKSTSTTKASTATAKPRVKSPSTSKSKPKATITAKAKAKAKAKPKPKAKPKARVKKVKVLTEKQLKVADAQKLKARIRELKETALSPPKRLAVTALQVIVSEGSLPVPQRTQEAVRKYKALTPEELEHYNHVANQNKAANEAAYKKWVSSHPVEEILKANTARLGLKRLLRRPQSFTPLKDDRIVKRPKSGYVAYFQERIASGDLKHMKVGDMGRLVGQEWRGLNSNEKKKYDDLAALDLARYKQEVKTVYNRDVPPPRSPAAAAAA